MCRSGRARYEAQLAARRLAGENIEETNREQIRALLSGPKLDFDFDELLRESARENPDVYR